MSYALPSDAHAAGDAGHVSDHNNIADVLTAVDGGVILARYTEPSGATASTFSRYLATAGSGSPVSGTLYVCAIGMHQNTLVSNITFATKGTALTGLSHGWYVLLDSGLVVRAVTADQTAGGWMSATNTPYTLAVGSAYTTTYSGLYYAGIMAAATGMPVWVATANAGASGVAGASPILTATSSTGQTTPPSTGATMGALTAAAGFPLYAYTS